ncbi:MAG: nucleoside deaminase [Clostridia bacterium]|nr:nucleoside deaminase [Clostridia bacterium]
MEEKFMEMALKEAKKAELINEVPIGCVLVKDGKVVAKAHNKKNTTKNSLNHAEILALLKYQKKIKDWHFDDITLYTTLEPCPMCAGAIINFRVKKVVFGAYDKKAGCCGTVVNLLTQKEFNHHPLLIGGVMENQCGQILTNFFKEKRKK